MRIRDGCGISTGGTGLEPMTPACRASTMLYIFCDSERIVQTCKSSAFALTLGWRLVAPLRAPLVAARGSTAHRFRRGGGLMQPQQAGDRRCAERHRVRPPTDAP